MLLAVDTNNDDGSRDALMAEIPANGKLAITELPVEVGGTESLRKKIVESYLMRRSNKDTASVFALASKIQYHTWGQPKVIKVVAKREHPACKLFPYNPLMTRKERYACLSSAILFS